MNPSMKRMGISLGLAALALFAANCHKKKDNNDLAILALILGQEQPGVYISGTLVDKNQAPLANATVQILGRGESSATVLPPNWINNNAAGKSNGGVSTNTAIPGGFLFNNSQGTATAADGSACNSFDSTNLVNTGAGCPATYIASLANAVAGSSAGAQFVASKCGSDLIAKINTTYPAAGDATTAGLEPLKYAKDQYRIYCDVTTLESAANAVGIDTTVQAAGTVIATFTTDESGSFSHVKFNVPSLGNTYKLLVTKSDGTVLKPRRLKITKNGVATLLNPVSGKLSNGPLELSTGLDITAQEANSWTSIFPSGEPTKYVGSYDVSFSTVSLNVVYPRNYNTISGTLGSNVTLTKAGSPYLLSGTVIVPSGVTLTIQAGTTIYGAVSPAGALLVKPGGKLIANGTSAEPITFTSSQNAGSRAPADWQGIILQGNAIQTFGGRGSVAVGEGDTGSFGGSSFSDPAGASKLSYVVVQFAGAPFSPGNERNCVSLMGVGQETTLDHVQCHMGFDDGFEQWGGAFTATYMISTGNRDDQFDFADGFIGKYQFGITHLYKNSIAANDDTSRCIEGDGNSALSCTASARGAGDCADPYFANITCVASGNSSDVNHGDAIFVRRAQAAISVGDYTNFLIVGYNTGGAKAAVKCDNTAGQVANATATNIYTNDGAAVGGSCATAPGITNSGVSISTAATNYTSPNYAPSAANVSAQNTTAVANFAGFTSATYYGAIDFSGADWTTGWATYPSN
ncbi:hypothetical protein CH370_02755 [Leptospira kmetyi]|uniref:hypothetical protein n=1 Tax=Leptospira kmetyi TaxID=408139 RepID=UPI000C29DCC9|nr:hypothetical protein [Leptospira kmetyi]PJZ43364.1 hypothetical protein CH370_02755 [Leptospira kmetyi]TGK21666.1 hypothetical protein EHO62_04440 [Leptospira kmetyi]TGK28593.1 hypothetical protein EHO66_13920 [Leptospira kmetyi]TGL68039.1 hypothetical protein EHQ67_12660 [Leptospira kmetyi]